LRHTESAHRFPSAAPLLALCVFGFRREQRRVWASIGLTVMLFWNVSLFVSLLEQNTLKIAMLGKSNACTLVITCGDHRRTSC